MLRPLRVNPRRNPLVERGCSKVYIDPDFAELVELAESRPDTLRFIVGSQHYGVASGYGSTHSNISNALRSMFGRHADGYSLILVTDASQPFEDSEWTMHPSLPGAEDDPAPLWKGLDTLPVQIQQDMDEFRKIWNHMYASGIARKAMRRSMR